MVTLAETTLMAYGAIGVGGVLGGGLTVSVVFAATVPVHEPIRLTLTRVCAWTLKALSVALRAFVAVVSLPYRLSVSYLHLGARVKRHRYVPAGRHRPAYVRRNPWTPVLTWSKGLTA
jgi:hypothetical protein